MAGILSSSIWLGSCIDPPGSVAMKLSNFASLDPLLRMRGIRVPSPFSPYPLALSFWAEYQETPIEIAAESEELLRKMFGANEGEEIEVEPARGIRRSPPVGPSEQLATVKVRRTQHFFREMILNAFESRCCVSGMPVRELLVASHILPWSQFPEERLNPRNGLCLSRLHDAAFDGHLIAFDPGLRLVLSKRLKSFLPEKSVQQNFQAYEGQPLTLPEDALGPDPAFLARHRQNLRD